MANPLLGDAYLTTLGDLMDSAYLRLPCRPSPEVAATSRCRPQVEGRLPAVIIRTNTATIPAGQNHHGDKSRLTSDHTKLTASPRAKSPDKIWMAEPEDP